MSERRRKARNFEEQCGKRLKRGDVLYRCQLIYRHDGKHSYDTPKRPSSVPVREQK